MSFKMQWGKIAQFCKAQYDRNSCQATKVVLIRCLNRSMRRRNLLKSMYSILRMLTLRF
jgi:hypothetical protein